MTPDPRNGVVHDLRGADLRDAILPTYARADVTIVRGDGCHVWDADGRSYLDFGAGIAVVGLGHCEPRVTAAAHAQLDRLWHSSNLYWTEPMLRLAALLTERLGGGQAFFCNSGAEANEAALKYARKATGRPRIVALEGGFHGRTLGALSATGQPAKWEGFGPLVPGVAFAPPNEIEALERVVVPEATSRWSCSSRCSARAASCRSSGRSCRPPRRSRARSARSCAWTRCRPGSVAPGTFFAHEQLGVSPISSPSPRASRNGLPIGALLVAEHARGGLVPGDHGSTFGGNPVACAAACAVVEAIDDELLANVRDARRRAAEPASRACPVWSRCAAAGSSSARGSTAPPAPSSMPAASGAARAVRRRGRAYGCAPPSHGRPAERRGDRWRSSTAPGHDC